MSYVDQIPTEPGTRLIDLDLEPLVRDAWVLEEGSHELVSFRQYDGYVDVLLRDTPTRFGGGEFVSPGVFGVRLLIAESVGDEVWQGLQPGEDYMLKPYVQFGIVVKAGEVHSTTPVRVVDADGVQWQWDDELDFPARPPGL